MAHQLIASPYPDGHLVVSPGREGADQDRGDQYAELRDAAAAAPVPGWLAGRRPAPCGAWTWPARQRGTRSWSARKLTTGTPAPATS